MLFQVASLTYLIIATFLLGRNLLILDLGAFSGHNDRYTQRRRNR